MFKPSFFSPTIGWMTSLDSIVKRFLQSYPEPKTLNIESELAKRFRKSLESGIAPITVEEFIEELRAIARQLDG